MNTMNLNKVTFNKAESFLVEQKEGVYEYGEFEIADGVVIVLDWEDNEHCERLIIHVSVEAEMFEDINSIEPCLIKNRGMDDLVCCLDDLFYNFLDITDQRDYSNQADYELHRSGKLLWFIGTIPNPKYDGRANYI